MTAEILAAVPQSVGVAAFQTADIQGNISAATTTLLASARSAEQLGASLAVFPECFLTGYTRDRHIAAERAVDLGGRTFRAILDVLRGADQLLVFGLIERDGTRLFNTVVLVDGGEVVGTYRKRHPNEGCFTAGEDLPVFDVRGLRIGLGICADARSNEDAGRLARANVDVVLYPLNNLLAKVTADRWRHRHIAILAERATQTGAWVISADVVGHTPHEIAYGCTAAVSPDGTVRERLSELTEGSVLVHVVPRNHGRVRNLPPGTPFR